MASDPFANLDTSRAPSVSKIDPVTIPGFVPSKPGFEADKHRVRYLKVDLDDLAALSELEILETKVLQGRDVYVLDKTKYSFMDKMYILVQYVEKF